MAVTSKQPKRLSEADLQRLLALLHGADSTELKLTVPDSEQRSAVAALGMDRWMPRSARSISSTPPTSRSTSTDSWCALAGCSSGPTTRWSSYGR